MTELANAIAPIISPTQLEEGEVIRFEACPFPLPATHDLDFLREQQPASTGHKDISFDPESGRLVGRNRRSGAQRLNGILQSFSDQATGWLKQALPMYTDGLVRDRVALRTEEEATRLLRLTSRNDLLHIDHFPTRPSFGRRILRLCVNVNPSEPRVWAMSDRFPELIRRFAMVHRIPERTAHEWTSRTQRVVRILKRGGGGRSHFDAWMMRLHHFLKADFAVQARAPRRIWTFPPYSAWLVFSDGVAHAQLRGRFALEHSYFVSNDVLSVPAAAPLSQLVAAGQTNATRRRAG